LFAEWNAATADLLRRFATMLDPEIRSPFCEGGIWLVRPDDYLACSTGDAGVVAAYLTDLTQSK
jgi:hypothetical protein